jgi:hypothetical protein
MIMLVFGLAFIVSLMLLAAVVAYHAIVLAVPIARLGAVLIAMAAVGVALLAQKAWRAVSSPVPANCALRSTVVPFASVC